MSRSTQYIGLTKAAEEWAKEAQVEQYEMTTGMFDEPVMGRIFRFGSVVAKEVVQVEPWSSGPMIFTCLEVNGVRRFEWVEDGHSSVAVDYEGGRYYV